MKTTKIKAQHEKTASLPSSGGELGNEKQAEKRAIGRRLAEARKACGLTQKAFADAIGARTRTVKGWEAGKSVPSGRFSAALSRGGINLAWLMKTEGKMFTRPGARIAGVLEPLRAAEPPSEYHGEKSTPLLREVVVALDRAIHTRQVSVDIERRADLIVMAYDLCLFTRDPVESVVDRVLRLIE